MISARFDYALQIVRAYLAECAQDRGDPRAAELTEAIRQCVEGMSENGRGHGQERHPRVPQEALRHALGYVDERSTQVQVIDETSGLA